MISVPLAIFVNI